MATKIHTAIRLTLEEKRMLAKRAKAEGRSASAHLRHLIRQDFIEAEERKLDKLERKFA